MVTVAVPMPVSPAASTWVASSCLSSFLRHPDRRFRPAGEVGQVWSVRRLQRVADVERGEHREDERLQALNQQLEAGQDDDHRERTRREDDADARAYEIPRGEVEHQQQQVPGEHIREQPDAERERPHDDVGEPDERRQQPYDPPGHAARDHLGEEPDRSLGLDADPHVGEPDQQDQDPDEADMRRYGELRAWDDLHQVHQPDEKEQRHQEGQVPVALLADHLAEDLVPHEQHAQLADVLHASGHQLRLVERRPEESDDYHDHDHHEEIGPGDVPATDLEEGAEVEVVETGSWVPAAVKNVM